MNEIGLGRRDLRKYLRGEDYRVVNCRSRHRTKTREKRRERVQRDSIPQASNIPSNNVQSLPHQVINQRQEDLEDIRVRSSNRFSASNQPQVGY